MERRAFLFSTIILALTIFAELFTYDPGRCAELPINCYSPAHPFRMAAGHDARDWYGRALACPERFPIGTEFIVRQSRWGLADGSYVCLDRGGAVVVRDDGVVVLDLLRSEPVWNEVLRVRVILPDEANSRQSRDARSGR